jgi:outer membrane protein OmpA-like peptidoglycan-associated protein
VEQIARDRELSGRTRQGVLFEFEILFAPNQTDFAADLYRAEFGRVLNLAATYPGAVIVVEGHSDPLKYIQDRQSGVAPAILEQTRQAAKNLSVQRAIAVRESLISYGRASQLTLDSSQFTVSGAGIERPKNPNPATEQEWRANMRVDFQITQVEAELQQFSR